MADLEKTVAIIFEGVDRMGAGVDSATKKIDSFADGAEKLATPLATVTKGILAAEAAAGAMAIMFGKQAYDAAVKFEAAQADLAKTLGEGDGTVEQYTRQITDLSNTYGESSTDLLQSMANYKQAGFTAEESLALVKNGLDLVIAGDVEARRASEILVATLKGFKAPASEAANLLEVLNASSNTYATDVDQLAAGMARLSPIANSMGLSFGETAELLIPVIEVFRSGPEAANALRTGLLRLGDDAKPVTDALASIGVAQRDATGALRDSSDILEDVAHATGGLSEAQKLFVASQLFGIEQAPKMVEVLTAIEQSTVDVSKAMEESTTIIEEVNIRLATAEKIADRTSVAFENMSRTMGEQFKVEMAGIIDAIGEVFRQFESATAEGAMDDFWNSITPTLREIERLALEVAEALPTALAEADYSGFADGMEALFGDLEDVEISAEDVQAAIEGLGETFRALSEFTAGTFEAFKGFVAVIKPVVEAFVNLDSETQKWIGVLGGVSLVVGPAAGAVKGLTEAVSALAGTKGAIPAATRAIPRLGKALAVLAPAGAVGVAVGGIVLLVDKLHDMNSSTEQIANTQAEIFARLSEPLQGVVRDFDDLVDAQELGYVKWDGVAGKWVATNDDAIASMRELFGASENMISEDAIASANAVAAAVGGVEEASDPAAAGLGQIERAAIDAALAVLGIKDGTQGVETLKTAAVDAALAVAGIGEGAEGINVLSADLDDTSKFVTGLDGNLIDVNKTITTLGDVTKAAGDEAEDSADKFSEMEKKAMELASNEKIKAMEFMASIEIAGLEADAKKVEAVLGATSSTIEAVTAAATDMYGTLGGGDLSLRQKLDLEDAIDQQLNIQKESAETQNAYIKAQTEMLRVKTDALRNGDGLIKIDSTGLEPALEMILWEILEKIQLRANAEGQEFLLGLNSGSST